MTEKQLEDYRNILLLLNSVNESTVIHGTPWSLSVFEIVKEEDYKFELFIDPRTNFMSIMLDGIGIIIRFIDNGAIDPVVSKHRENFVNKKLSIIQFLEISSWVSSYSTMDLTIKKFAFFAHEIFEEIEKVGTKRNVVQIIPQIVTPNIRSFGNIDNFRSFAETVMFQFMKRKVKTFDDIYCKETNTILTNLPYLVGTE